MRISDWSSDVCSSDLFRHVHQRGRQARDAGRPWSRGGAVAIEVAVLEQVGLLRRRRGRGLARVDEYILAGFGVVQQEEATRSEEHTSELQSLIRNSYAVFCLQKKKN